MVRLCKILIGLFVAGLLFFGYHAAFGAVNIYVATNGSDANSGAIGSPVLTLGKAQTLLEAQGTANNPRYAIFRGGAYSVINGITLNPPGAGSSVDDTGITFMGMPGETAKLYGGLILTQGSWTGPDGNGNYTYQLPGGTNYEIQGLMDNNVWVPQAVFPAVAPFNSGGTNGWLVYTDVGTSTTALTYSAADIPGTIVGTNIEIEVCYSWNSQRTGCSNINTSTHVITMYPALNGQASGGSLNSYPGVKKYRIWNTLEGLTHAGQWYFNRAQGQVVFKPYAGENPNTHEMVVPIAQRIWTLGGFATGAGAVTSIGWSNLNMYCCAAQLVDPADAIIGWDQYGIIASPGNSHGYMVGGWMAQCFMGCTVGAAFNSGFVGNATTSGFTWTNDIFGSCDAAAIVDMNGLGLISNCLITNIGNYALQGAGIILTTNEVVKSTTVSNAQTSLIRSRQGAGNNLITLCDLSKGMQDLQDMGALYFYGNPVFGNASTNNTLLYNFIHDCGHWTNGTGADARNFFRNTIYWDEESRQNLQASNIIQACPTWNFNNANGSNLVQGNIVIYTNLIDRPLRCYASSDSVTLSNRYNVLLSSNAVTFDNSGTAYATITGNQGNASPTSGFPAGYTVQDPQFTNFNGLPTGANNLISGLSVPQLIYNPNGYGVAFFVPPVVTPPTPYAPVHIP